MGASAESRADRLTPEEWTALSAHRREAGLVAVLVMLITIGILGAVGHVVSLERPFQGLPLVGWVVLPLFAAGAAWFQRWRRLPGAVRERFGVVRRAHAGWWWGPHAAPIAVGLMVLGAVEWYQMPTLVGVWALALVAIGSRVLESWSRRRLVEGRA